MIRGLVQGVGFRPFICRCAVANAICGEVVNRTDGVSVIAEGDTLAIDRFIKEISSMAPPASEIKSMEVKQLKVSGFDSFSIAESRDSDELITEISPDIAVCSECLIDMSDDPARKDYPFVNCTNCGPRFTIIKDLPYDRAKTTMKEFVMCGMCETEYHDILDRRYHAQPVACNSCGPEYRYNEPGLRVSDIAEILERICARISSGMSVAVKGLGGYHLMCDALNNKAVTDLRQKKQRDAKPFAVMFRDISAVREYCITDDYEENELASWRRPILILRQRKPLAEAVSSGLATVGAMLPYMPLHYMLFRHLNTSALVMTSGNISDEPVIKDDALAKEHLMPIAGAMMSYNREIFNRTDDSVVRVIGDKVRLLRRSRGYVPRPVEVNCYVEGILATGAEQKNTFCIGKGHQAIMSQHIGDLKNLPANEFFTESIERLSGLFRFNPELIACDLHPEYLSTIYAGEVSSRLNVPLIRIQHHHAHIASCMAEYRLDEKVIGISLDGTGYGTDGNIWGSEFMIADLVNFQRYGHFDYFKMPGGDAAVGEPWRMALSCLVRYFGDDYDFDTIETFRSVDRQRVRIVREMIRGGINTPMTCGAGRLFDAVAALTGLCINSRFDSEAPMRLESAINTITDEFYPFSASEVISFHETFDALIKDLGKQDVSIISARFHNTLANAITEMCLRMRSDTSLNKVVLSGGVFQNRYLLEKSLYLLAMEGFEVFSNHIVPANDGGIALGQAVIASKRSGLCV